MILAVTLARGGSKSIPKKNIALINGKPLLCYTIDAARKSRKIDKHIINTDCAEIAAVAEEYGAEVQFGRPEELSTDSAPSGATLEYVVRRYEEENNVEVDTVVELMATNPLKNEVDIDCCIEMLQEKKADSVIAMGCLYDHHPSRIKYLDENGVIRDFYPEVPESRRQDLTPKAFIRAGSIYVMTTQQLQTGLRYGGDKSFGYILPDERFLNIDEPRDLLVAQELIKG
ncbi:acylneuraminate cytidylyltransferase family protein [Neptuniibacter caesariensis]|uniref:CMP-N-acetylneuraminic acid synthetase n=1 Tax=Neptuniibacter caesariensis TaxID=207954 RepID=A0A7U8C2Y7_NEPCE|nr:acylneuraminate cytidylyltransferase family protein [Neptuniibacter caesariensis]EAR60525.1 CMP-N-acetylneuraminic acid synthetase [Oceanospirillum sp. MED92] [Neptuniibacter caesariensis]